MRMLSLRLIFESFRFAFNSLVVNQLRTFLSLLGITIGIFCIISVFTVIDSLESTIRQNMAKLGTNVIYIQKWPWTPPPGESEYPWWKYLNRPTPKMAEAQEILRRSNLTQYAVFNYGFNRTVQSGANKADNVTILGTSAGLIDAWDLKVEYGRPLSDEEFNSAPQFAMIGSELGSQLFRGQSPVGKSIKVQGFNLKVIGVFEKMGEDMFGTSMDNRVLLPVRLAARMVDLRQDIGQSIIVKGKTEVPVQRLTDELEGLMRSLRRIKPFGENDFALNEVSLIAGRLDSMFMIINFAGWIIGGFAILVGGFGIANIMFVSVRERTKIIGLQKAMGAKKRFILMEFLFEASALSLIGGAIGLMIIYIATFVVSKAYDFNLTLTIGNIIMGLSISIVIGLIAGLMPARTAARLDPVTAMNTI
jgi:putative ABC transport system permease protein